MFGKRAQFVVRANTASSGAVWWRFEYELETDTTIVVENWEDNATVDRWLFVMELTTVCWF